MLNWDFDASNYNPDKSRGYQLIPPGKYRVRIEDVEETTSSTGKPMVKLTLEVNGYDTKLWHNLVLDNTSDEAKKRTDDRLGQLFDSFNIQMGNLDTSSWKGKAGAAEIKNEPDYKDKDVMRAKLKWFIKRSEQDSLPKWQENSSTSTVHATTTWEEDNPKQGNSVAPIIPEMATFEEGEPNTGGIPF